MIDTIENKFIDKMSQITRETIISNFNCQPYEVGEIIQKYLNKRKIIDKTLDLSYISGVNDLGNVKKINGNLYAHYSSLRSLNDLRRLNGELQCINTPIETTGKLTYCEGIYIASDEFNEIKKISEVNGDVRLVHTKLKSLSSLKNIVGNLSLFYNQELENLGSLNKVVGNLTVNECPKLNTLNSLEYLYGSLDMRDSSLGNLGKLRLIDGIIITKKSQMKNFDKNDFEFVNLSGLNLLFPQFPKSYIISVSKLDRLENFNIIVIDDV